VLVCQVLILRRPTPVIDISASERAIERLDRMVREELSRSREEENNRLRSLALTIEQRLADFRDSMHQTMTVASSHHVDQLNLFGEQARSLAQTTEQRLEAVRTALNNQLEQMRRTVDEQLQGTLERRLGESFRLVSERLEQVYKGLGEMHTLASEVGDVKRALTNVRTRGIWGEVGVRALLEETLAPDQFAENVAVTGGLERVEFAVRLPGGDGTGSVWLPIDAKFPLEDYLRVVEASASGDAAEVEMLSQQLQTRVRECAKSISAKYLQPPMTTDFAILYLPTESLYAEVLRRPGLVEILQRDYRVTVAGPTTLSAFLNSLRMGFRTLAIQHQSSEVWKVLGEVKTEFGKYSEVLAKVQKKLQEAANTVDTGLVRTRAIERKLRDVESLPSADSAEDDQSQRFSQETISARISGVSW
jgi:DNA recombination protein RmuC